MYNWNLRTKIDVTELFDLTMPKDETFEDICAEQIAQYLAINVDATRSLESSTRLSGSTMTGSTLDFISLTGLDNFFISDPIVYNDDVLDTDYVYETEETDKFIFHIVSGHTTTLEYNIEIDNDNSLKLNGGFLQGFYKIHDYPFELIQKRQRLGWTVDMIIKLPPLGEEISGTTTGATLNTLYPSNHGFIFYMGTRAENKFHNVIPTGGTLNEVESLAELEFTLLTSDITNSGDDESTYSYHNNPYLSSLSPYSMVTTGDRSTYNTESFNDAMTNFWGVPTTEYPEYRYYTSYEPNVYGGFKLGYAYGGGTSLTSTSGDTEDVNVYYYTLGDQLKNSGDTEYVGFYHFVDGNPYSGRAHDSTSYRLYHIFPEKDIVDNAFGLRITNAGKIGYRKITVGTKDNVYTRNLKKYYDMFRPSDVLIEESYSCQPIYGYGRDEKINITATFTRDFALEGCELETNRYANGTLKIYVNGFLVFKDENFREILTRELLETPELQQSVPFNLSWGGGSQGLYENVTFGGPDPEDIGLMIEQYFAGSFMGNLYEFNFYTHPLDFTVIKNNFENRMDAYDMNYPS